MPLVQGRRVFLRSGAGAALALPLLPSVLPRRAEAGLGSAPRRFIALQSMSGQLVQDCWPTATPPGYQLRDQMYDTDRADGTTALRGDQQIDGVVDGRRAPLADFAGGPLTRTLGTDFEPYFDQLTLVRGIDYMSGIGHNNGGILGNYKAATMGDEVPSYLPTIDQVLASSDKFYEQPPIERMLHMSTGWTDSMSYADESGSAVNARSNPLDVWQNFFSDFEPPDVGPHPNVAVLNALHDDYVSLRQSQRLSAADRQTLEQHMTLIRDIEERLGNAIECTKPEEPADIYLDQGFTDASAFEEAVDLLVMTAVFAIRCDLTRIVTFNLSMGLDGAGGTPATSLHNSDGISGDWHDFAHAANGDTFKRDQLVSINRWVATAVLRRFMGELDVDDGTGSTFLDNSLIYWGGELSLDHYSVGMPTVLAGRAGGAIDAGYYVDYTQLNGGYANPLMPWGSLIPGMAHNRLLVTILQAMGLAPGDYERDGLPGYGHNVITGNYPYGLPGGTYPTAELGTPLPGLFA